MSKKQDDKKSDIELSPVTSPPSSPAAAEQQRRRIRQSSRAQRALNTSQGPPRPSTGTPMPPRGPSAFSYLRTGAPPVSSRARRIVGTARWRGRKKLTASEAAAAARRRADAAANEVTENMSNLSLGANQGQSKTQSVELAMGNLTITGKNTGKKKRKRRGGKTKKRRKKRKSPFRKRRTKRKRRKTRRKRK